MPVASISRAAPFGRRVESIGTWGTPTLAISVMRFPSTTISTGPRGGPPAPSISGAARGAGGAVDQRGAADDERGERAAALVPIGGKFGIVPLFVAQVARCGGV